eukprot:NODE_542_length_6882_cov_0.127967.p3 type:complete len:224 gc:universal NODE_542_length_6882_cov_0.127967:285-956(+)
MINIVAKGARPYYLRSEEQETTQHEFALKKVYNEARSKAKVIDVMDTTEKLFIRSQTNSLRILKLETESMKRDEEIKLLKKRHIYADLMILTKRIALGSVDHSLIVTKSERKEEITESNRELGKLHQYLKEKQNFTLSDERLRELLQMKEMRNDEAHINCESIEKIEEYCRSNDIPLSNHEKQEMKTLISYNEKITIDEWTFYTRPSKKQINHINKYFENNPL